jgi:drug/metabolite transporter (DMT)-like permease
VFAFVLSALLLDEQPQWYHYGGMLLVFSGILLTTRRPAAPAQNPQKTT